MRKRRCWTRLLYQWLRLRLQSEQFIETPRPMSPKLFHLCCSFLSPVPHGERCPPEQCKFLPLMSVLKVKSFVRKTNRSVTFVFVLTNWWCRQCQMLCHQMWCFEVMGNPLFILPVSYFVWGYMFYRPMLKYVRMRIYVLTSNVIILFVLWNGRTPYIRFVITVIQGRCFLKGVRMLVSP